MNEFDPVKRPRHYNTHASLVECIEVTEQMDYCTGNALKYVWRSDEKDAPLQDLKKALWYIERAIARVGSAHAARAALRDPRPVERYLAAEPRGFRYVAVAMLWNATDPGVSREMSADDLAEARDAVAGEIARRERETAR